MDTSSAEINRKYQMENLAGEDYAEKLLRVHRLSPPARSYRSRPPREERHLFYELQQSPSVGGSSEKLEDASLWVLELYPSSQAFSRDGATHGAFQAK